MTSKDLAAYLDALIKLSPQTVSTLLLTRVPLPTVLEPTTLIVHEGDSGMELSALGILNGFLAEHGQPPLCFYIDDRDELLACDVEGSFTETPPETESRP
jgi:hypothetical protein